MTDKDTQAREEEDRLLLEAVRRVLDGDVEAFALIVETCQGLVAADLVRRLPPQDVQEVAQNTFVRAYRSLGRFRNEAPLRIWLLRVARHTALDFWRKKYRRREMAFSDIDETALRQIEDGQAADVADSREVDAQEERRAWLEAALRRLSPDDRAIITLVELEEKSMVEAAKELGCGLAAVRVRAFRARKRLKRILEELAEGKDEKQ